MSARPSTPNTPTARRTAGSSSSLNPRLPRQPSNPLLANNRTSGTIRTSTSPVKQPSNGRLSPTKRSTAASSSSNNTLKTALSSASLASQRSAKATKPRPARHSSDDPETSDFPDEDSGEEEEADREVPTRKAGFGLPPPPKSPRKVQDSTRSLVQLGENGEEDEEATDGKAVNVVVCLRCAEARSLVLHLLQLTDQTPHLHAGSDRRAMLQLSPSTSSWTTPLPLASPLRRLTPLSSNEEP